MVAGAGFGKSTLLAAWAQRHDVAWYTLGAEDAALSTLGRGLVDALRLRVPDLPVDLAATPGSARGPDASADEGARADAFAAALSEALQERLRRPLALVLDDLHALAPDGAAMRAVEALCRQAPAALHVVLASRTEPAFSIDRLRGQGQVLELGGADLAFDADEVRAVLAAELDGDARELGATLHTVTEGWPAAVRLACEAMRALAAGAARRGGRAPAPARRGAVRLPGARGARAGGAGRARAGRASPRRWSGSIPSCAPRWGSRGRPTRSARSRAAGCSPRAIPTAGSRRRA